MDFQFGADEFEFTRPDEFGVCDRYAKQFAFDFGDPKIEKRFEFWKARSLIVFLPDIALDQRRVIGKAIEYFCGRQTEAGELRYEAGVWRHSLFGHLAISLKWVIGCEAIVSVQEMTMIEWDSFLVHRELGAKPITSIRIPGVLAVFAKGIISVLPE
jgi:hypothetical protein